MRHHPSVTTPPTSDTDAPAGAAPAVDAARCPVCDSALTSDPRFVSWCTACRWNAVPTATDGAPTAAPEKGFPRRLNRALEEQLFQEVISGTAVRSSRDGTWLAAMALAGLVHLFTLALLLGGGWMLFQDGWPLQLLGVFLIVVTVTLLRPRLGSLRAARKHGFPLSREDAPELYALADRAADALRTRRVDLIRVDLDFNASYQQVGLRRRALLTLGLPLWESLQPGERVALLGHEFGHGANGDARRGLWLGTALCSLAELYQATAPQRLTAAGRANRLASLLTWVLMSVANTVVEWLYHLLNWLTRHSHQRAEYLADAFALQLGGTAGATGVLEALTLSGAYEHQLVRWRTQVRQARQRRGPSSSRLLHQPFAPVGDDFWGELRSYVASIPQVERDRRMISSQLLDQTADSSHPPTHLRLAFVRHQPVVEPSVTLTAEQIAAIDRELGPARASEVEKLD